MNVIAAAQAAIALISSGREALAGITDSIRDGKTVLAAGEQAELDTLLAQERQETEAAYSNLKDAIAASRRGH